MNTIFIIFFLKIFHVISNNVIDGGMGIGGVLWFIRFVPEIFLWSQICFHKFYFQPAREYDKLGWLYFRVSWWQHQDDDNISWWETRSSDWSAGVWCWWSNQDCQPLHSPGRSLGLEERKCGAEVDPRYGIIEVRMMKMMMMMMMMMITSDQYWRVDSVSKDKTQEMYLKSKKNLELWWHQFFSTSLTDLSGWTE